MDSNTSNKIGDDSQMFEGIGLEIKEESKGSKKKLTPTRKQSKHFELKLFKDFIDGSISGGSASGHNQLQEIDVKSSGPKTVAGFVEMCEDPSSNQLLASRNRTMTDDLAYK